MNKIRTSFLAAAAVGCICAASIGNASAYFTTQASAEGVYPIQIQTHTDIEEPEVAAGVKHLVVSNKEDSQSVFVRAKAFAGEDVTIQYSGDSWMDGGDGYYYYADANGPVPLKAGDSTDGERELQVHFTFHKTDVKPDDSYNVIVVYEAAPVQYHADGTAYADWNLTAEVEGGTGE